MHRSKRLWELFSVFFRISLFTFGGGYAMISIIEDSCVERKAWITAAELDDLVVLAESTPGPVAINCATFIGYRQCGLIGAVVATLGVIVPPFFLIFAISRSLDRFLELRLVANAFRGVKIAVSILILDAGRRLFLRMPKKPLPILLAALSLSIMLAASLFSLHISTVVLLLASAAVSLAAFGFKGGGKGRPEQ